MVHEEGNDKMNRLVGLKQFEITRGALLTFMETLDDKTADTQPKGFNNTIRWHIGHVLTAAEVFMFGKEFKQLPTEYPVCLDMDQDHLNGQQQDHR